MKATFQTRSPIDNTVLLERPYANAGEIEATLASAYLARKLWRNTSLADRISACRGLVDYFLANAEAMGEELTRQMGRPIQYAPAEITKGFQERALHMMDIAPNALKDISTPPKEGFYRFMRREPIGTVLVLAPWNYPYLTAVNVIIPALLAGNTVILKHAEQTPLCAERFAEAFKAIGLPEGVFQYFHLTHPQVADVIKDRRISYVAFTGSVAGGQAIQKAAGNRFITAGLELGGKDPAYVREDADIGKAIVNIVDGAFFNSGQSCCGIERVYVHESLFTKFIDGAVTLAKNYKLGNPLDESITLGPMVRPAAAAFAQKQVEQAVAMGAKALVDPKFFAAYQEGTAYMAPQVLIDVNHKMDIMREETFAPVMGVMPVKNDEEAIHLMNDSPYGLTASIWTKDRNKAIDLGEQLETGTCFMNRCDYLDPALAWTGVKNSGKGCTLSPFGFAALVRLKSFHLKNA